MQRWNDTYRSSPAKGYLMTELIVALTVLAIILVCSAAGLYSFRQFTRCQWLRQQCVAAAQAQLDSLAITGKAMSDTDVNRLWPRVTLTTQINEGQGQWQGLQYLEVTALGRIDRHTATVRLSRYISPLTERAQGTMTAAIWSKDHAE